METLTSLVEANAHLHRHVDQACLFFKLLYPTLTLPRISEAEASDDLKINSNSTRPSAAPRYVSGPSSSSPLTREYRVRSSMTRASRRVFVVLASPS